MKELKKYSQRLNLLGMVASSALLALPALDGQISSKVYAGVLFGFTLLNGVLTAIKQDL